MPKTTRSGKAKQSEIPSTLQRSPRKAQRTFAKAHDSAAEQYGEGRRANQTAWSAVKHSFEKVGDHWEKKDTKGPSDERAKGGRNTNKATKGGVDANASKSHMMDVARRLDISGRSKMKKDQLVGAIKKASDRQTAKSRNR